MYPGLSSDVGHAKPGVSVVWRCWLCGKVNTNSGCSVVLFRSSFIEMFYIFEIKYENRVEYPRRKQHPVLTDGAVAGSAPVLG